MNIKTLWNERFGMLMASGSPGSALAYYAGSRVSATAVVRRKNAAAGPESDSPDPQPVMDSSSRGFRTS